MQMNPEIKKLEAVLDGKSAEWRTLAGISSPELIFAREGLSAITDQPFAEQRFAIQQEMDFPLAPWYRIKRVLQEKQAVALQLEALKREVTAGVKSRYVEVLHCGQLRKLRAEALQVSKEIIDAVNAKEDNGATIQIDRISAEIRLYQAENHQYEAERDFHGARYRLFSYIGMNPDDQRYDVSFADTLFTNNKVIEQEVALCSLEEQPLYRSAKAILSASDLALKEAKSAFLPSLRAIYMVQDFGTGYRFHGFEAGITVPLWGMFREKGMVDMARSTKQEAWWNQKAIGLDIKEKTELAWHGYDQSQVTIQIYQLQLRQRSESLLALAREAYRLGQIDQLKLIEAKQLYLGNQEDYLNALKDYYLRLIELEQYVNEELVY
jgi:outer membrane protein, heavy metal efflux system